eukprot:884752_1
MTESDGVIYQFDDINHVRFIVPFGTTSQYAHVFVKPKANFDFVFIKRLHVQRREDITNKIDYLLTALKSYDLTITNPKQFYEYVGVMMQPSDTPDVQKSMQLYAPTVMGTRITCLHRLVHELELTELSDALRAFDSKMECVGMFKAFNCNILQIVSNSECDEKEFLAQNEYKFVSYSHVDSQTQTMSAFGNKEEKTENKEAGTDASEKEAMRAEDMGITEVAFKYNDKIIVSNNTSQQQSHKVWISNPKLFGITDYIELQHMDGAGFNQFSSAFYNALAVIDDRIICVTDINDFIPDYGEYSVVEKEASYQIVAKSFYPTIRPNCALTDGKYCFEVEILSRKDRVKIGFAEQGFVPKNKNRQGASQSLSWAISSYRSHGASHAWSVNDIIHCCIDVPNRLISYFVNGEAIDRSFESININQRLLFPVVSLCQDDTVEIRFDQGAFKYPIPIGYDEIQFKDHNVFFHAEQEILNAKYAVLCNEHRPQIKAEHVDNAIQLHDMQNIQFVVPFCVETGSVSIYVQFKDHLDFVQFKSFKINQNHDHEHPQIQYFIDILTRYNVKIRSPHQFWKQIGFNGNDWIDDRISIMKKKFHHILFKPTLLNRLHHELHIAPFKDVFRVMSTKFKFSLFDQCVYRIDLDKNEDHLPFTRCTYVLIGAQHEANTQNEADIGHGMTYKYNEEIRIDAELGPFHRTMELFVMNEEVFETDQLIELQQFKTPMSDHSDLDDFKCSLYIEDNRFISLRFETGDYGEYDACHRSQVGCYRITSKSESPTVRANCLLSQGRWYYKVAIVETTDDMILIGFANTDFKPSPHLRVGEDQHSWSYYGVNSLYNGEPMFRRFEKGDVIKCSLDIATKRIGYYLNEQNSPFQLINMDFGKQFKPLFPCIALKKGQIIDVEFDPRITFEDKSNIFVRQFKLDVIEQILKSKYTVVCNAQHSQVKQLKANDNIYEFNTLRDVRFLIPEHKQLKTNYVSLFVQNRSDCGFVLFKTFGLYTDNRNLSQRAQESKSTYLYKALLGW